MRKTTKGSAFLLSAALVWGLAFVAQKDAAGSIGVMTYICLRALVTCLVLAPICIVRAKRAEGGIALRRHLLPGAVMGMLTFFAIALQQWGLEHTTASKSGFVTALYIVIVPLFGLMRRRKLGKNLWMGVAFALVGTALLSLDFSEGLSVGLGEALTFGCALIFSVHILFIDSHTHGLDAILLCALQFGVCFLLGGAGMLLYEAPTVAQVTDNLPSILYVGAISGGVGYTFQLIGQKYAEPALASILMCMESVFAAVGGWLIAGEMLLPMEYLGCALMLAGCVLAQLPKKQMDADQIPT
ncbi:MAG: DMT family transporter [Christensenellales bacterium]|jgi:drug/metabolite transporter (DMT)-like permease